MKKSTKKSGAVTMADVAREVGVSKMTVSYALSGMSGVSEATRQSVVEVAQRLGFEPNPYAQRLSNSRSNNTVGLFALWLDFGVGTQKIQLIQSALNRHGFDVPIYGVGLNDSHLEGVQVAAIASIRRQKPRALVCFTQRLHPKTLVELRRYQDEGGIVVSYDYPVDLDCDSVVFNREDNTYQAARHLLELGHRGIGYGAHGFVSIDSDRVRGLQRAVLEFGGEWREEWMLEGGNPKDYTEGGYSLAMEYLHLKEPPSALCIVNDATALIFLAELERAGVRCPHDVSIVGHDNHPFSRRAPVPLTTISHPSETIAHEVAQLLVDRLNGEYEGPARHIAVRGELIERESATHPKEKNDIQEKYDTFA